MPSVRSGSVRVKSCCDCRVVTMVPSGAVACVLLLALTAVAATTVRQCKGKSIENLSSKVELSPCKKPPCKLKKGTNQQISISFTPEKDMSDVKNSVQAEVFGVPLPFVGVDGNSVCDKLYTESDEKASCPLKAGSTYIYKDSFPVLSFYPNIDLIVNWALRDAGQKDVICFMVPAKIVA